MSRDFVHLHGHTIYSESDSTVKIKELVSKAKQLGMPALAVTEHGNMYSMVKFLKECQEQGVKPLLGCEFYMVPDRTIDLTEHYHLVVLAKNNTGLVNLYKLASDAGMHKLKGKTKDYPRTDEYMLEQHSEGLIVLSACLGGLIPKMLLDGDYTGAKAKALQYSQMFEDFYLEIQPHDIREQLIVNDGLKQISKETGIPLVITGDYHYIEKDAKKHHDVLMQIGYRSPFTVEAHFRTADEIEKYCFNYGIPLDAMDNTVKIANMVNISPKPKDHRGLMPQFACPIGYTEDTYLYKLAMDKFIQMAKERKWTDVKDRLKRLIYELEVICSMGFAGYFLILWDWFDWCRRNGILMGKGRGSAAGSLVSYVLKITTIDPVKNGYFFERFLNPERIEFPDVDSDISKFDRPKAIGYLLNKYGADHVAQIITFTKLKLKSTIKAGFRVLNLPFEEGNEITKALPDMIDGKEASYEYLEEIFNDQDEFTAKIGSGNVATAVRAYNMLQDLFKKYPDLYDIVSNLVGCITGTGIHAGGVIVSSKVLNENIPLTSGSDTAVLPLVQISMEDLDFFNALKIDALGLATLSQVKIAMDLIPGLDMDWFDSEDFDDPEVYKMLRDGLTTDVFQMGSSNATRMIRDMNVENFDELTDVNAGNRPGPLSKDKVTGKSMVDIYIENKKRGVNTSTHPDIDPILAPTKGCMWYQEQLMAIGQVMAGYSLGNADLRIRKVLGKKKVKEIPAIEAEFIYGKSYDIDNQCMIDKPSKYCVGLINRGYDEELGKKVFNSMADFAKYCFNKAHSGAYAALAYKTAWLKRYYPVEWSVACLKTHDKSEKIVATISDAKKMGIPILPPDINESDTEFSIVTLPDGTKGIRYGLSAIKNVGVRAVELIKKYRPFSDFNDFYTKVHNAPRETNPVTGKLMNNPLDKTVETSLIQAGAFDCFEENRYKLLNYYNIHVRKDKNWTSLDEKKFTRKVKLKFEKDMMDMYISEHPLDPFPYESYDDLDDGDSICVAGIVKNVNVKLDKRKRNYAVVTMEAKDGKDLRVLLQSDIYEKFKDKLNDDEIIIVDGTVNKRYNNISCSKVRKLVRQSTQKANTSAVEMPVRADPMADITEANPLDTLF